MHDAESILFAAIAAADPTAPVQRALESAHELAGTDTVRVIAIGKAALPMAAAAMRVLAGRRVSGVVVAPAGGTAPREAVAATAMGVGEAAVGGGAWNPPLSDFDVFYTAHPTPDAASVNAALAIDSLLGESTEEHVVVVLVSGGASALVTLPAERVTIDDYAACTNALMKAGADIAELNTVRKHIDRLKGGGMAARAAPARVLGLVLSDVPGDPVDVIASGPLSPDRSTCADAERVLRARGVWDGCAETIRAAIRSATETPKPRDPIFDRVRVAVIASNDIALDGAADRAGQLGYDVRRVADPIVGEARVAGTRLARDAKRIGAALAPGGAPVCMLAGGETTVTVHGTGRGGRNQELVLAACIELGAENGNATRSHGHDRTPDPTITVASIGTDGIDGPTDAAGAIAGPATLSDAARLGVDPRAALANNDSYGFFHRVGGLIRTGRTGTNVMDVQVVLIGS